MKQDYYINRYSITGIVLFTIIGICINELGLDFWIVDYYYLFPLLGLMIGIMVYRLKRSNKESDKEH